MIELRPVTIEDGYLVTLDGEIVGLECEARLEPIADDPGVYRIVAQVGIDRLINSIDELDQVLDQIGAAEALGAMFEKRIELITRNLQSLAKRARNRARFLRWRYGPQIEAFARQYLDGKKGRTLTTAHGKVAFRASQGQAKITNLGAAVAWATENKPEIVKTETKQWVNATDLRAAIELEIDLGFLDGPPAFLAMTGPTDNCTITTGTDGEITVIPPSLYASPTDDTEAA